ncbi:hypothetical protein JCM5353_006395 [Sporobolomyces roseus]
MPANDEPPFDIGIVFKPLVATVKDLCHQLYTPVLKNESKSIWKPWDPKLEEFVWKKEGGKWVLEAPAVPVDATFYQPLKQSTDHKAQWLTVPLGEVPESQVRRAQAMAIRELAGPRCLYQFKGWRTIYGSPGSDRFVKNYYTITRSFVNKQGGTNELALCQLDPDDFRLAPNLQEAEKQIRCVPFHLSYMRLSENPSENGAFRSTYKHRIHCEVHFVLRRQPPSPPPAPSTPGQFDVVGRDPEEARREWFAATHPHNNYGL